MLEVMVWVYGDVAGNYTFEHGELRWSGHDPDPFNERMRKERDGPELLGPILATDDLHDGWIGREEDPERWLRRLPGFLAMRGIVNARIVRDD